MNNKIAKGIYPTMITPFTDDNKVDYNALEELVEWYIQQGVDGLFAVCQSSEMFYLDDSEKLNILKFVTEKAAGRVSVVVSGHTNPDVNKTIEQMKEYSETGADAVVLISNLLATEEQDKDIFKKNFSKIMDGTGDIPMGIYECPYPFKYVLPDDIVKWCAESGRVHFVKDTCCDIDIIKRRIDIIKDTPMMIFNANTATILESLRYGCHGYSGVMANFHPRLYKWLYENVNDVNASKLSAILTSAALIEYVSYPRCAKKYLKRHINIGDYTRKPDQTISACNIKDIEAVAELTDNIALEIIGGLK